MRLVKKQTVTRAAKPEPRSCIVSFRLREGEVKRLSNDLADNPIAGVSSVKQYARKLVVDYANDRLVYIHPLERSVDSDALDCIPAPADDCQIKDKKFTSSLRRFLSTPSNWNKLRLFMLRIGWPEEAINKHKIATGDQARVDIALQVLEGMENK